MHPSGASLITYKMVRPTQKDGGSFPINDLFSIYTHHKALTSPAIGELSLIVLLYQADNI